MKDDNKTKSELINELIELRDKDKKLNIELSKKETRLWIDEIWYGYVQSPIPNLMLSQEGKERHVQFSVYEMSIHHDQSCGWRILWKTFG